MRSNVDLDFDFISKRLGCDESSPSGLIWNYDARPVGVRHMKGSLEGKSAGVFISQLGYYRVKIHFKFYRSIDLVLFLNGIELKPGEVVGYLDGNKKNSRFSNLVICGMEGKE